MDFLLSDFGFGTLYEIEWESSDHEEAKKLIEEIEFSQES